MTRDVSEPERANSIAEADTEEGVGVLDLRGLNCPLPAMKAARRLRDLAPGDLVWVETTDPLATIDIPAMARERGHALINDARVEGGHRFLLERGPLTEAD